MAKSTSKLFQDEETKQVTANEEAPVSEQEPKADEKSLSVPNTDDIQDVELSAVKKQRFRFNHDNSKILELNTSDLNIITRLTTSYDRLNKIMEEVAGTLSELPEGDDATEDKLDNIGAILKKLDDSMKEEVDFIFEAPVSKVLCSDGSMYDPIDGMFRYEHIIDKITSLYENNLNREFTKMRERVNSKTSRYTKKFHR